MTGYSGRALIEKLGYTSEQTVLLIDAPTWFSEYLTASGLTPQSIALDKAAITPFVKPPPNWGHAFFSSLLNLQNFCDRWNLSQLSQVEKGWWVSWPKKSSGVTTDLTEQSFRDYLLPLGWVDTKVCAIDDTWSGLKFVRRKV